MNRDTHFDLPAQPTDWLMNTARRNPEGLLLLAAGCVLLLRSGSGRTNGGPSRTSSTSSRSYTERSRESLSRAANEASDRAADFKDKVSDTVSDYARSASDYADETKRMVSGRTQEFARQAQSTVESTISGVLREQPLAVAMVGLAVGAAVAAAFPATDIEKRTLGATGEALADAAEKTKDSVMEAAAKAGERLKTGAEERGLTTEGLKELAGAVTDAFKDSISGNDHKHRAPTTGPGPGVSGLESKQSSPADPGAGVRSADIARTGSNRGGSNR